MIGFNVATTYFEDKIFAKKQVSRIIVAFDIEYVLVTFGNKPPVKHTRANQFYICCLTMIFEYELVCTTTPICSSVTRQPCLYFRRHA